MQAGRINRHMYLGSLAHPSPRRSSGDKLKSVEGKHHVQGLTGRFDEANPSHPQLDQAPRIASLQEMNVLRPDTQRDGNHAACTVPQIGQWEANISAPEMHLVVGGFEGSVDEIHRGA